MYVVTKRPNNTDSFVVLPTLYETLEAAMEAVVSTATYRVKEYPSVDFHGAPIYVVVMEDLEGTQVTYVIHKVTTTNER